MLLAICQRLEHSNLSRAILESDFGFGLLIIAHVLGLGLFLGTVLLFDLRLLERSIRTSPVSDFVDHMLPWTRLGFGLMAVSVVILFCTEAVKCYQSTAFRLKMAFILLGLVNVAVFHQVSYSKSGTQANRVSWTIAGAASLLLWLGALAAGRAVGYDL